jgi:hypothetical protein
MHLPHPTHSLPHSTHPASYSSVLLLITRLPRMPTASPHQTPPSPFPPGGPSALGRHASSWPTCQLLADMPTTSTDQPTSRSHFPLSPLHPSRHILVPLTVRQPNPTLSNPLISHHSIRSYAPIRWIRSHAPPMSATNLTSFPSIHSCLSISVHPLPSIIPAH